MKYRWHICQFDTTEHLRGKKRTYEAVKEAALAAGRFSAFEASDHPHEFNRLVRDPEVVTDHTMGYPWIGIRRKA